MKQNTLLVVLLIFAGALMGNPPEWAWMQRTFCTGNCIIYNLKSDSQDRINVTGYFEGELSLGAITLNSAGSRDAFVAQLDVEGNWLWACSIGGTGAEYAHKIAVDAEDNIYVGGLFYQDFTVGTTLLENNGNSDIFCVILSSAGNILNAIAVGSEDQDTLKGLAVTLDGILFLSGNYRYSITIGSTNLTNAYVGLFISKWDNQLNPIWAQQASSVYGCPECANLGTDNFENCYITGYFLYQCAFGYPNQVILTSQETSGYIVKLDVNGNAIWGERISDGGMGIMDSYIDPFGNSYITCDIFFIITDSMQNNRLDAFTYCGKLDFNQNWEWYNDDSAMGHCIPTKICGDETGNCYITGKLWGNYTFGDDTLTGYHNNANIYVAMANPQGQWQWGLQTYDAGYLFYLNIIDITALETGGCVITGSNSTDSLHFGDFFIPPSSNRYSFIVKVNGETQAISDPGIESSPQIVLIYPNPSQDIVRFQLKNSEGLTSEASIYNIKGQLVKSFPNRQNSGVYVLNWNGCNETGNKVASGIYILSIKTEKGIIKKIFTRL